MVTKQTMILKNIFFFVVSKKVSHTSSERFLGEGFLENYTQVCLISVVTQLPGTTALQD